MTTAELLGKVVQRCYEITQEGKYDVDFEYDSMASDFSVILSVFEEREWKCIFNYPTHNVHYVNEENLKIALEKLENIDETYRELVE